MSKITVLMPKEAVEFCALDQLYWNKYVKHHMIDILSTVSQTYQSYRQILSPLKKKL